MSKSTMMPKNINIFKQKEQDMNDRINLSNIIKIHSSNFFNSQISQQDKEIDINSINKLLEDINIFGEVIKKEIKKEQKLNIKNSISIVEAFNVGNKTINNSDYKNGYYVLALLANALNYQGCNAVIENNNSPDEKKIKELNTTIQFLVNGRYNNKKYIFYFDFGEDKNNELLKDFYIQNKFNYKLKKKLQSYLIFKKMI